MELDTTQVLNLDGERAQMQAVLTTERDACAQITGELEKTRSELQERGAECHEQSRKCLELENQRNALEDQRAESAKALTELSAERAAVELECQELLREKL